VKTDAAVLLVVEMGSVFFFLLLLPLVLFVKQLKPVWLSSRWTGVLLSTVLLLTTVFFALFIAGIIGLTFGGAWAK
jgi:hypothetical protein